MDEVTVKVFSSACKVSDVTEENVSRASCPMAQPVHAESTISAQTLASSPLWAIIPRSLWPQQTLALGFAPEKLWHERSIQVVFDGLC